MIETASVKGGDIRREVGKTGEAHRILAASSGGRDWARFMGFLRATSSLFRSVSFGTSGCVRRVNLSAGTFCFLPAPAKGRPAWAFGGGHQHWACSAQTLPFTAPVGLSVHR